MSRAVSISAAKAYTLSRVCRVWGMPRSSVYHRLSQLQLYQKEKQRPGPQGVCPDEELTEHIRAVIDG